MDDAAEARRCEELAGRVERMVGRLNAHTRRKLAVLLADARAEARQEATREMLRDLNSAFRLPEEEEGDGSTGPQV